MHIATPKHFNEATRFQLRFMVEVVNCLTTAIMAADFLPCGVEAAAKAMVELMDAPGSSELEDEEGEGLVHLTQLLSAYADGSRAARTQAVTRMANDWAQRMTAVLE